MNLKQYLCCMAAYNKEVLISIVKDSITLTQVLQKSGKRAAGGNFNLLKKYINLYNIDISHFDPVSAKVAASNRRAVTLQKVLVTGSTFNRNHLKERLYKEGLKSRICEICGQGEVWMNRRMSLILDHKNGIYNDNRLENLQIVCPNCNATLETHCGKNK